MILWHLQCLFDAFIDALKDWREHLIEHVTKRNRIAQRVHPQDAVLPLQPRWTTQKYAERGSAGLRVHPDNHVNPVT